MKFEDMAVTANQYTDENYSDDLLMAFANEAIAQINTEINVNLPFITDVVASYYALSESWIRALVIPYMCWSIKMNDGSLNEADRYQVTFNRSLEKLKINKNTAISEEYQNDDFNNHFEMEYPPFKGI